MPCIDVALHPCQRAIERRPQRGDSGQGVRTEYTDRFAKRPDAARAPVRHALDATGRSRVWPSPRIDEVDELPISLFHGSDKSEEAECLIPCGRVASHFVATELCDRRAGGI